MKRWVLAILAALLVLGASACGADKGGGGPAAPETGEAAREKAGVGAPSGEEAAGDGGEGGEQQGEEQERQRTVYPITVTDASGVELTFEQAPERIVSTSPAETEILFALGLGDRIVGVSDFDNYPEEAQAKPKVGGVVKPNEEAIIAAAPDLVIGGISMEEQVADRLRSLQLKLYMSAPKTLQDVLDNILQFGRIADVQDRAEAVVAAMREQVRVVSEATAGLGEEERKRVYIEYSPGWTVGKGEFMDELIGLAGAINIAGDMEGWVRINEEKIIRDDPEVILYADGITDSNSGKELRDLIKTRSGWSEITAVREDRLVALDRDMLARPGPRLTDVLYEIARGVYPELFEP